MRHRHYFAFALAGTLCGQLSLAAPVSTSDDAEPTRFAADSAAPARWEPPAGSAEERLAAVVDYMRTVDLQAMEPLPAQKYTFPGPSIHVMRVKLHELYSLDGIGSDRVELTGWIAVRQEGAQPARPASRATWRVADVRVHQGARPVTCSFLPGDRTRCPNSRIVRAGTGFTSPHAACNTVDADTA